MKRLIALAVTAATLLSVSASFASPPKKSKTKPVTPAVKTAKLVEVMHCPITGEAVTDKSGKTALVDNKYKVHFCCAGCPEAFAKLSKKDQLAKAKESAAKDAKASKKS